MNARDSFSKTGARAFAVAACAAAFLCAAARADVDWTQYSESFNIKFPGYSGNEVLADFPVLIRLTPETFGFNYAKCQVPGGGDVRFSDLDGNLLSSEVDTWVEGGTSLVWVKVPTLDKNTMITVHYGCSSPAAVDPKDVWSNGYLGVWHMNEAARPVCDSTTNGINFTRSYGYNPAGKYDPCIRFAEGGGAVGRSVGFDPTVVVEGDGGKPNQGGLLASDSQGQLCGLPAITIEIWAKTEAFESTSRYMIGKRMGNTVDGRKVRAYEFEYTSLASKATFYLENGENNDNDKCTLLSGAMSASLAGQWNYHCACYDSSAASQTSYFNGEVAATTSYSTGHPIHDIPDHLCLGNDCQPSSTKVFNGSLDELRISNVARSAAWVKATYGTIHDDEFAVPDVPNDWTKYSHKFSMTFPGAPATPLTDFPVLVRISESSITNFHYSDLVKENGEDLRFTDESGNVLDCEIDTWDTNGTSLVWVKVPLLSSSTRIEAYYGWEFAPAVDSKAVWSNGYLGVWHLGETGRTFADSTLTGVNFTLDSKYTNCVGRGVGGSIGSAVEFDLVTEGENAHKGRLVAKDGTNNRYSNTMAITVEAWMKQRSNTSSYAVYHKNKGRAFAWQAASGSAQIVTVWGTTNETAMASKDVKPSFPAIFGEWYHVAAVYDNVSAHRAVTYVNGENRSSASLTEGYKLFADNGDLYIGNSGSDQAFSGSIDEVRVSSEARSAEWVKATCDTIRDGSFAVYSDARENVRGFVVFFL